MISLNPSIGNERYLSHYTTGRDNNFTLMRFVAATCVLITHSYVLSTGRPETEPLRETLGLSLGTIAVHIFFVASGFLVTGSLLYRQSLREFIIARALRIYPALWVALILTIAVVGIFFTTLSWRAYISDPKTWAYVARNAVLIRSSADTLPGAFADVPWKDAVNGSLWTLPWEIRMYVALAGLWLLAKLGKMNAVRLFSIACITLAILGTSFTIMLQLQHKTNGVAVLGCMFFMGASLRILQDRILVSHRLALPTFAALLLAGVLDLRTFGVIYALTLPYLVIYFSFVPGGFIRRFNSLGDYSYGIYIYAFPVQQGAVFLWRDIGPFGMMAISFVVTLVVAMTSWHLIESRALAYKARLMQ